MAPPRSALLILIVADFSSRSSRYRPERGIMMTWLETEAMAILDGRILLDRLLDKLRTRRIVLPGISVVETLADRSAERRVGNECVRRGRDRVSRVHIK